MNKKLTDNTVFAQSLSLLFLTFGFLLNMTRKFKKHTKNVFLLLYMGTKGFFQNKSNNMVYRRKL